MSDASMSETGVTPSVEQQFLLRSLRDLEVERSAGDIDEVDYITLRDGYTARAAAVIKVQSGANQSGASTTPLVTRPRGRALIVGGAIAVCACGIGWFMASQLGQRLPGQSISGGIANSSASLLSQARAINFSDPQQAVDLYSQVLKINPDNVEALTYRAWLVALVARDASDDLKLIAFGVSTEGFSRAISLDGTYPDAHCFLGIVRFRLAADAKGAKEELQICQEMHPPAAVRSFVDSIIAQVDAALAG